MATVTHARLFWSGGSQAVRLPKAMRLPGKQVLVRRRGKAVILEPLPEVDDWSGFWDRLVPLARPIRRGKTRPAEQRAPL
jgi:antitoxin VapB